MAFYVRFSDEEQALIRQYARIHGMRESEVVRMATLDMVEDDLDIRAFKEAKDRFAKDLRTYSMEEVGRVLGLYEYPLNTERHANP